MQKHELDEVGATTHTILYCYRKQSDALFGKTVIAIMPCLTEVERGQAISQLMQGHTQRQVAVQFGVNVRSIQPLVIRLRVTGRVADRPRFGRPRVTSRREDRTIRLAHLRDCHLTATETARNTIGTHNHPIHAKKCKESAEGGQSRCASSLRWSPFDAITSTTSDELAALTCTWKGPHHAMEACTVHG